MFSRKTNNITYLTRKLIGLNCSHSMKERRGIQNYHKLERRSRFLKEKLQNCTASISNSPTQSPQHQPHGTLYRNRTKPYIGATITAVPEL